MLLVQFLQVHGRYDLLDRVTYYVVLMLSYGLSVTKPLVRPRWAYLLVVGIHLGSSLVVLPMLHRHGYGQIGWTAAVAVESTLYVSTTPAAFIGSFFLFFHGIGCSGILWGTPDFTWELATDLAAISLLVSGSLVFSHYRNQLVDCEQHVERLDSAVVRLSRANTAFQERALDVQELSSERERRRITRDIHDLVGYTLTNSIVTMEAAVDMIRVDPLRVPALLRSARDNAEDGLQQIRESLYRLRDQKTEPPRGVSGIGRMLRNFRDATGIETVLEVGGIPPLDMGERAAYVTHHFVQEAMINSFRHGRATKILVMLFWADDRLVATVWDDGPGVSEAAKEGIGISGMRERAAQLEGTVSYERVIDGFSITLSIPRAGLT
jgi:signal transduction histidine kinase